MKSLRKTKISPLLALGFLALNACSSTETETTKEHVVDGAPAQAPVQVPAPLTTSEIPQMDVSATQSAPHAEVQNVATTTAAAHHNEHAEGTDPETALRWLRNGNQRFLKGFLRKDGQSSKDRTRLASGQKPHTIVLSCSDSRVPPEVVFDQKLGEIFVVRTAGEALDNAAIASIEYAVSHLGSRLILVMGHTACGAVKATIEAKPGVSVGSPALDALVADIAPRVASVAKQASPQVALQSETNAKGVAVDLIKRSTIIGEKATKGELKIVPSLYHLDTGAVDFF